MRVLMVVSVLMVLLVGCGGGSSDEPIAAATEIAAEWGMTAFDHREQKGDLIAYVCPAEGELAQVWGNGPYTDDSSVCSAGVHAGVITVGAGGRVVIEITDGEVSYEGSEANGVITADWPAWPGSFEIVRR